MKVDEQGGIEKIGFFSKIKRSLASVAFETSLEEEDQPLDVAVPARASVPPESPEPSLSASAVGRIQAHSLGLEDEEEEVQEVEPLVITSEGVTGTQVRRSRGYGATVSVAPTVQTQPDWLLAEGVTTKDALSQPAELAVTSMTESSSTGSPVEPRTLSMANNLKESLNKLMDIDGATAVALVDGNSGMAMGTAGGGALNLDVAAAGNSEVVKAKLKTMKSLGLNENIEDILISLNTQYHLIRPLAKSPEVFLYLALNRSSANLAMARHKLAQAEKDLEF